MHMAEYCACILIMDQDDFLDNDSKVNNKKFLSIGCQATKLAHFLKHKPEIYTQYLPSDTSKIQFSLALQL